MLHVNPSILQTNAASYGCNCGFDICQSDRMPKLGRYSSKTYILPNENYHFISQIRTPSLTRMTPSSRETCLAPTSHGSAYCTVKTDNSLTTIHGPYNCDRNCCMAQLYPAMLQKHGLCKKTIERCSLEPCPRLAGFGSFPASSCMKTRCHTLSFKDSWNACNPLAEWIINLVQEDQGQQQEGKTDLKIWEKLCARLVTTDSMSVFLFHAQAASGLKF